MNATENDNGAGVQFSISMVDLVLALSNAVDLVSPHVAAHHKRVTYIAHKLGEEVDIPESDRRDLVFAAGLHDIGAFSLQERLDLMEFEMHNPHRHAELGYRLLKDFAPLSKAAEIVRYHHHSWNGRDGTGLAGEIPGLAHLLHLADRIDILSRKCENILTGCKQITEKIVSERGTRFAPRFVDAFLKLAEKEYFWLDLTSNQLDRIIANEVQAADLKLERDSLIELMQLFSHIIDFKSPWTSTHTAGVAAVSEELAKLAGLPEDRAGMVLLAGLLHDFGKLAIPGEILDKPGKLTRDEFSIIKGHPYFTRRVLEGIKGLEDIVDWGASHHEHLDGQGYPLRYRHKELSLEARIIAVADVFTAIAEDRPYRKGLPREQQIIVLKGMVRAKKLDQQIVDLLVKNIDRVEDVRTAAQADATVDYCELLEGV